MQEGLANICLVTGSMTIVKQKIEVNIPKKRRGTTADHDKGLKRFYDQILQGILRNVNFEVVKVLILASPGFVKDDFYKHLNDGSSLAEYKPILENRSKIVLVHSSSGQKQALSEILADPLIQSQLSETKYAQEIKLLNSFYKLLANDSSRAFYGIDHVSRAAERGCIETLLLTDGLFR
jgi:protein pelota